MVQVTVEQVMVGLEYWWRRLCLFGLAYILFSGIQVDGLLEAATVRVKRIFIDILCKVIDRSIVDIAQ